MEVLLYYNCDLWLPDVILINPFCLPWNGLARILIQRFSSFSLVFCTCTSAISSYGVSAEAIYYTKCLCVLSELCYIRIFTGHSPLPLASEKIFKGVLAKIHAEESKTLSFHFRKRENEPHQTNERFDYE